jgi:hypothetical protein
MHPLMQAKNTVLCASLCLSFVFVGSLAPAASAQGRRGRVATSTRPRVPGMYSTMKYFRDTGDVGGIEVFIVGASSADEVRYFALVQLAEGVPKPPVLVEVSVKGDEVRFTIPGNAAALGTFVGRVTEKALVGEFSGDAGRLELLRGKSYWQ